MVALLLIIALFLIPNFFQKVGKLVMALIGFFFIAYIAILLFCAL